MRSRYQCSSRKKRELPQITGFGRVVAVLYKKASDGLKFMQLNMGLCCMFWPDGGDGVGYFFLRPGAGPWVARKIRAIL